MMPLLLTQTRQINTEIGAGISICPYEIHALMLTSFFKHITIEVRAGVSNYIHQRLWDVITDPSQKLG